MMETVFNATRYPALRRMMGALGVADAVPLSASDPAEPFLDQVRNTLRDKKADANALIENDVLTELLEVAEGADERASEMAVRCTVNALCDNGPATDRFADKLGGVTRVVTLLHRKSSPIAFHLTKLLYMLVSQRNWVVVPTLLAFRLDVAAPAGGAAAGASVNIADVFTAHLERCRDPAVPGNVSRDHTQLFVEVRRFSLPRHASFFLTRRVPQICKALYALEYYRANVSGGSSSNGGAFTAALARLFDVVSDVALRPHRGNGSIPSSPSSSGSGSSGEAAGGLTRAEEEEQELCRQHALQVVMMALDAGATADGPALTYTETHRVPVDSEAARMVQDMVTRGASRLVKARLATRAAHIVHVPPARQARCGAWWT